jgi:Lar family restriction alleviation protein
MREKLRPCPFCGNDDQELLAYIGLDRVTCGKCGSSGPPKNTDTEKIAAWNKRTERKRTKVNQELKPCPFCGEHQEIISHTSITGDNQTFFINHTCGNGRSTTAGTSMFKTKEEVIAAWNKRVTEVKKDISEKGEIDKFLYCSGNHYKDGWCLFGDCVHVDSCERCHRKYPTPEQYLEEYGEEWVGAAYMLLNKGRFWRLIQLIYREKNIKRLRKDAIIVYSASPWKKPDNDWRPE